MAGAYQRELRRRTLERMAATGSDVIEVWHERTPGGLSDLVGHMHVRADFRSDSPLYDVRPGDFRQGELGGRLVWIAHWGLGAGDLGCIPGFRPLSPARHVPLNALDAFRVQPPGQWPREVRVPLRQIPSYPERRNTHENR